MWRFKNPQVMGGCQVIQVMAQRADCQVAAYGI